MRKYNRPEKFCECGCGEKVSALHIRFLRAHKPLRPLLDRFWERVDRSPGQGPNGDCWEWQGGGHPFGYGDITRGRKGEGIIRTHVLSFQIHGGSLKAGEYVLHRCDNPRCVNPDHLFKGTHLDNIRDATEKGRIPSGSRHWNFKHGRYTKE